MELMEQMVKIGPDIPRDIRRRTSWRIVKNEQEKGFKKRNVIKVSTFETILYYDQMIK